MTYTHRLTRQQYDDALRAQSAAWTFVLDASDRWYMKGSRFISPALIHGEDPHRFPKPRWQRAMATTEVSA